MTWPRNLKITDPLKSTPRDHQIYRAAYPIEAQETWKIVEPLMPELKTGKVEFAYELMPREDFGQLPPTAQEMADAQEDLWLLANIFRGIAYTNKDVQTQNDAPVRQIYGIRLMGGTPRAAGAPPDPSAGQGAAIGGSGAMGDGGGGMGRGGMGGMNAGLDTAEFEPRDEFGSDTLAGAIGGGEGGGPAPMPGGPMGGGAGMPTKIKAKRYIDENPKWKTRGFYIVLAVDHRRLPDLLVNLTNQAWPITIKRVHQKDLYPELLADAGGGAAGAAPPGGGASALGGMPGGIPGGMPGGMPLRPAMGSTLGHSGGGRGSAADGGPLGAPMPFRPPMGEGGGGIGATPADQSQASTAMNDPMLAQVAISGVITIYNPPTITTDPAAAAQPAAGAAQPAAPTAPADGTAPVVAPTATATTDPAAAPATPAPAADATAPAATPTATPPADPASKPAEAAPAPAPVAPAVESSTNGTAPVKPPGT